MVKEKLKNICWSNNSGELHTCLRSALSINTDEKNMMTFQTAKIGFVSVYLQSDSGWLFQSQNYACSPPCLGENKQMSLV